MLHPVNAREKPQEDGVFVGACINAESKKKPYPTFLFVFMVSKIEQ